MNIFWPHDLDFWPMTLTFKVDLDILWLDLRAKIQSDVHLFGSDSETDTHTLTYDAKTITSIADTGGKNDIKII